MTINNHAPSLFEDGQIGMGLTPTATQSKVTSATNLVDLLHEGFLYCISIEEPICPSQCR